MTRQKFFNGPAFTRWSTDIAYLIEYKGKRACIFNETSYSHTTSHAQNCILRALPNDIPVFRIGNCGRGIGLQNLKPSILFNYAIQQAVECADKATRARSNKKYLIAEQSGWMQHAKEINSFFGLRRKVDSKTIDRLAESVKAKHKRQVKLEKERQARLQIEHVEKLQQWLAGERV